MQSRRVRWQQFRHYISQRAKTNFTYLLSERHFRGKLITDHKKKELDMTVR
jgi:structural maintenance of chromosomes protein 6